MLLVFGDGTQQADVSEEGIRQAVAKLHHYRLRMLTLVKTQTEWLIVIAFEDSFDLYYLDEPSVDYRRLDNLTAVDDVVRVLRDFAEGGDAWSTGFKSITPMEFDEALEDEPNEALTGIANVPFMATIVAAFAVRTDLGFNGFVDGAIEGGVAGLIGALCSAVAGAMFNARLPIVLGLLVTGFATVASIAIFLGVRWLALGLLG
ncbi:hypothetical protein HK107_00605 [Parvularcula sp. ZS-1/3]|uniref:Uncharacterized protein n=1 Tax=Parvularcula mediterranea TaxID=2732508 RepID=A0A7Y3RJJ0_9PROT|nr:hypothetical protein [Parvularcula mediterranea]NNU14820.1 hypothetical protein [Parvularcula mediterranea]